MNKHTKRIIALVCVVVFSVSAVISGTLALSDFKQHKTTVLSGLLLPEPEDNYPTDTPSVPPSGPPAVISPTVTPEPTPEPTGEPTPVPTGEPSPEPSPSVSPEPSPDEPTPSPTPSAEPHKVTIRIRKLLLDENNVLVGTGAHFAVRMYDASMNEMGRYILTANGADVIIAGLDSGTTYYFAEEPGDWFSQVNMSIAGYGTVPGSAVGVNVEPLYDQENMQILVICLNVASEVPENPPEPPFTDFEPPDDFPEIDITDDPPPLSDFENPPEYPDIVLPKTGDTSNVLYLILLPVSIAGLAAAIIMLRRKRVESY